MNQIVDVNEGEAVEICSHCGKPSLMESLDLRLCSSCIEERQSAIDALKAMMRKRFNLDRSPSIRNCFLKLLLAGRVDLEPSGWKKGMALCSELMASGFKEEDARRILVEAGGSEDRAKILLEKVCKSHIQGDNAWTCGQLRGMEMDCSGCTLQFKAEAKKSITEICYDRPSHDKAADKWSGWLRPRGEGGFMINALRPEIPERNAQERPMHFEANAMTMRSPMGSSHSNMASSERHRGR